MYHVESTGTTIEAVRTSIKLQYNFSYRSKVRKVNHRDDHSLLRLIMPSELSSLNLVCVCVGGGGGGGGMTHWCKC